MVSLLDMSEYTIKIPKCDPDNLQSVLEFNRGEAHMFKVAAERCDVQKKLRNNKLQWYPIAAGVLFALSAELYLKFLLTAENKQSPRSHDLKMLFSSLDPETQNNIINVTKYDKSEFDLLLEINKEMFENWRYMYEEYTDRQGNKKNRADNLGFINNLVSGLESIVNSYSGEQI